MAFSFSASVGVQGLALRHLPEPLLKDNDNTPRLPNRGGQAHSGASSFKKDIVIPRHKTGHKMYSTIVLSHLQDLRQAVFP